MIFHIALPLTLDMLIQKHSMFSLCKLLWVDTSPISKEDSVVGGTATRYLFTIFSLPLFFSQQNNPVPLHLTLPLDLTWSGPHS